MLQCAGPMAARREPIDRLADEGRDERRILVADMAAARQTAKREIVKSRPWVVVAAGVLAAAGAAFGVAALVRWLRDRRKSRAFFVRAKRAVESARDRIDEARPRPLPLTLVLLALRSPFVRRALARGLAAALSRSPAAARRLEDKGEDDQDGEPAPPRRPESAMGAPDPEKAAKNRNAPPEEVGEQKASETLDQLGRAPLRAKVGFVVRLFKESFQKFQQDEALTRGAALAYYTMLSLAPLLIVVVAVAGLAFGADDVRARILGQVGQLVGKEAAATVGTLMVKASKPSSSIPAAVIGVLTLLIGAGGVFGYLQDMMNKIWRVEKKTKGGIWSLLRGRFLSLAMVLGTGFLLLVSLVVSAGISAIADRFSTEAGVLFHVLHEVVSWGVIALMFALIFRYLPDTHPRIAWRDVWIGAGITSLLFALGQFLIGLYLGRASVASVYGGAGSLVIVLLWTYYSGLILFFGAEMTAVFANTWGSRKDVPAKKSSPR
jgi:membrane protein